MKSTALAHLSIMSCTVTAAVAGSWDVPALRSMVSELHSIDLHQHACDHTDCKLNIQRNKRKCSMSWRMLMNRCSFLPPLKVEVGDLWRMAQQKHMQEHTSKQTRSKKRMRRLLVTVAVKGSHRCFGNFLPSSIIILPDAFPCNLCCQRIRKHYQK